MKSSKCQEIQLAIMILAAGCNFTPNNGNKQQLVQNAAVEDLLNQNWDNKLDSMLYVATATEKVALLEQVIQSPELTRDFKVRINYINMLDSLAGSLPE